MNLQKRSCFINNMKSIADLYFECDYQDFINMYYENTTSDWCEIIKYVTKALYIENEKDYLDFIDSFNLKHFDYQTMKFFYKHLVEKDYKFDEDILQFIAFLKGYGYFERIGNPSLEIWLKAKNPNEPYNNILENGYKGNSLLDLINYHNGMNVIRSWLLSCLKY